MDRFEWYYGESIDIEDPLAVAKLAQDRILLSDNIEKAQELAAEILTGLNEQWKLTGQNIVVRDYLIGPTQEPNDPSPYEIYKQAGGVSAGFSWLYADLDFGNNLYLTLVVKHTTKERISSLEVQKTEKKYHAPVYANPQFELLDVAS